MGEDEDYYYYYDFNSDENFNIEDFPDYEDYQTNRNKGQGKCIKLLKNDAKSKEWTRKIGPLWRSLAQQIGVRRCKKFKTTEAKDEAIRFGI